jgi:hypothetical protein
MSHNLTVDNINRFEDYKLKELKTPVSTKTENLSHEEKQLIEYALNKAWINPKFKMKYFQAEEQLTPFHKLRQLLLELRAQEESIESVEFILKKIPTELEIVKLKKKRADDELELKELEIQEMELERDLNQAKRRVAHNYIERHLYLDLIKDFLDSDEGKSVDGKSLMDAFDTPLEDEYEKQYWVVRLAKQASMDLLSYNSISAGNMSAITTLPQNIQNEIFSIAHHYTISMKTHQEAIKNDMAKAIGVEAPSDQIELIPPQRKDQNSREQSVDKGNLEDVYNI